MQLIASPRQAEGKASRKLRPQGKVPAVVYGQGRPAEAVAVDAHELDRLLAHSGRTQLLDLVVDGGTTTKVLIKDVQMNPRRNEPVHVDFHAVSLLEKVQVEVPLNFVGESPAVRAGLGDLIPVVHSLTVECLPTRIPDTVDVSIEGLLEADQAIRIGELTLPEGIQVIGDPEETLVRVQPPRVAVEEEAEAIEAEAGEAEPAATGEDQDQAE
ncbi:MAG: 50S ribosomal protein L25 [Candidatus Dormibacteraceae bacterium]